MPGEQRVEYIGELVKKKVVLLGDSAVGKTSLIRRYVIEEFHDHYIETIGTKISRKDVELSLDEREYSLNLQIWDVLGQKAYSSVQSKAFVGMNGALLVCDITRKETFESLKEYWLPTMNKVVQGPKLVFLINKVDRLVDAQFTEDDVIEVASEYAVGEIKNCFLTSAKTGENVEEVFMAIAQMMVGQETLEDPTKEIFEELMAEGVYMEADKSSLLGVTDMIITDFCREYGDKEKAMEILRGQFVKAGVEVSTPTRSGMERAVELLGEELEKIIPQYEVDHTKDKWFRMIRDSEEGTSS